MRGPVLDDERESGSRHGVSPAGNLQCSLQRTKYEVQAFIHTLQRPLDLLKPVTVASRGVIVSQCKKRETLTLTMLRPLALVAESAPSLARHAGARWF